MPTNPFFQHYDSEQNLIDDLTIEAIQVHGKDLVYIPRTSENIDYLFGEDTTSSFNIGHNIEMYIQTVDGFEGSGDFLGKFGLQIKDSCTLIVSKKRFQAETGMLRPREGDLIYFPLTKGIFEIKFTEHENPFYQVGKLYSYKLSCELFEYSHEDVETDFSDVDRVTDRTDNDPYNQSTELQVEGHALFDFSEIDPFSEGNFGGATI